MSTYKLIYFDARSRGEPARMLFELIGQAYEDVRYEFEAPDWQKIVKTDKKKFPFGQLPVLDVDGVILTQSQAIYRYIARKFPGDYYGKTNEESSRIDEFLGILYDIEVAMTQALEETDATKRDANLLKDRDTKLKCFYDFISESLEKSGGKYLVGNRLTLADIVIFNIIDFFLNSVFSIKTYFDPYPNIVKFYESFKNDSPLTPYIKKRKYTKY